MTEDKATQGWRKQRRITPEGEYWEIWLRTDNAMGIGQTRMACLMDESSADLILAAFQRPRREVCTACEALHRFHYVPEPLEHTHAPTKPPSREATLVEALRKFVKASYVHENGTHFIRSCRFCGRKSYEDGTGIEGKSVHPDWCEVVEFEALISPPGLSTG